MEGALILARVDGDERGLLKVMGQIASFVESIGKSSLA
jgi:hypothetical protein